jgi:rRNA maturation protein Rpf1
MKTRSFSRTLANVLPHARYVTRGKKNVHDLVEYAQAAGLDRIGVLGESHGNANRIGFITVDADGWDWAPEILQFKNLQFEPVKKRFDEISVQGRLRGAVMELFNIEDTDEAGGADLVVRADDEMTFIDKDNVLLSMHVKIVEKK